MDGTWRRTDQIVTQPYGDGVAELVCPRCGSLGLHHAQVVVYDRAEDAPEVTITTVINSGCEVVPHSQGTENPSSRRDGIAIRFWCEVCGQDPIDLTLGQHEGGTQIGWRFIPDK